MNINVLALGAVLILPVIGGLWRFSSLQGDLNKKWKKRVQMAEAGLSEKATEELRKIKIQVDEILVSEETFDPIRVVADPGNLLEGVQRLKHFIDLRYSLNKHFQLFLRMGPIFLQIFLILLVGLLLTFAFFIGVLPIPFLGALGVVTCSGAIVFIAILFGVYVFLQNSLSNAEILYVPES